MLTTKIKNASLAIAIAITSPHALSDEASDAKVKETIESFLHKMNVPTETVNYSFDSSSYNSSMDQTEIKGFRMTSNVEGKSASIEVEHLATRGSPTSSSHQTIIDGITVNLPQAELDKMHPDAGALLEQLNNNGGIDINYAIFVKNTSLISSYSMKLPTFVSIDSVSEISIPEGYAPEDVAKYMQTFNMTHLEKEKTLSELPSAETPRIRKAVMKVKDEGIIDAAIKAYNKKAQLAEGEGMTREMMWSLTNMQIANLRSKELSPEVTKLIEQMLSTFKGVLLDKKPLVISYNNEVGLSPDDVPKIVFGDQSALKGLEFRNN